MTVELPREFGLVAADAGRDGRRRAINVELLVQFVLIPQAVDERTVFGNLCVYSDGVDVIIIRRRRNVRMSTGQFPVTRAANERATSQSSTLTIAKRTRKRRGKSAPSLIERILQQKKKNQQQQNICKHKTSSIAAASPFDISVQAQQTPPTQNQQLKLFNMCGYSAKKCIHLLSLSLVLLIR